MTASFVQVMDAECEGCGSYVVRALLRHERSESREGISLRVLEEGTHVFCCKCYCMGVSKEDDLGKYIDWGHDICAKCYREMDANLEALTARVLERLREQGYELRSREGSEPRGR
jgi:hypothetical protein